MAAPMEARLRNRETLKQLYPMNIFNEVKEKAPPKSAKLRSKEYWERLKLDPKTYAQKLESQLERSRQDRERFKATATDEEKERRRAANNERVRRYRERVKAAGTVAKIYKTSVPLTRKQKEQEAERKRVDKERKRKERKNWSAQKRTAENKKARDRYHKKNPRSQELQEVEDTLEVDNTVGHRSKAARVQAVVRLTKSLPKDPAQKQMTIDDFVKRHKSTISKADQPQSITSAILSNEGLTSHEHLQLKRLLAKKMQYVPKESAAFINKELKLRNSQVEALSQKAGKPLKKPKSRYLKNICDIHQFFKENSRIMPLKRTSKSQARVLEQTLRVLHSEFLKCYDRVNFSTFCKYRPRYVKPQACTKFNQALCEICENIELKLKAINIISKKPFAKNKDDILCKVLCRTESRYYKPTCINMTCESCGPKSVWSLIDKDEWNKEVELKQWQMKEVERGGKSIKKKALVREVCTVQGIVQKLEDDLKSFPRHSFLAKWQYCQFNSKKKNLGDGEVVAVLDFAENYRCSLQDEAQSAHWCYGQATMHPIVCYYKCRHCTSTTTESLIMISDDLTHDSVAVREFTKIAYEHLTNNDIPIKKMIQFTDGCSSQFKSKKPFFDIEKSKETVGVEIERNFFGSRHGKNPSDGESAVVKNAAMRAVKSRRTIIQTAKDLYQFGLQNLKRDGESSCVHFKRNFFFVDAHRLQREREKDAALDIPVLKGTRQLHSIRAKDGILAYRDATCFCGEEPCLNKAYVGPWKMCSMQRNTTSSKRSTRDTEPEDQGADTSSHLNTSLGLSTSTLNYLDELNGDVENLVDEIGDVIPVTETNVNIPSTSKPQTSKSILPGCWAAVVFPGKVERIFLAFVLEVDAQEALVKFCRRSGSHFIWPTVEDISWMPLYSLTRLEAPEMDTRERMFLKEDIFEFA